MPGDVPAAEVRAQLERAHRLGFLRGELDRQVAHAEAFADVVGGAPGRAVDLGSGGGVPGLVLVGRWPGSSWILVDRSARRAAFLTSAVRLLGVADRVDVEAADAEAVGRGPARGQADLVTARGFGPPGVTAECAAPLLAVGGRLVVSEPPGSDGTRWAPVAAADLGLALETVVSARGATFAVLVQREVAPRWAPRRPGVPARSPRF